jgi:hypothetical protein
MSQSCLLLHWRRKQQVALKILVITRTMWCHDLEDHNLNLIVMKT